MRRDREQLREPVLGYRHALLEQDLKNILAAGKRMFVARLLALKVRIVAAHVRAARRRGVH